MASSFWGIRGLGLKIRAPTSEPAGCVPEASTQPFAWPQGCGLPGDLGLEEERSDAMSSVKSRHFLQMVGPLVWGRPGTLGEPLSSCCFLCGCPI